MKETIIGICLLIVVACLPSCSDKKDAAYLKGCSDSARAIGEMLELGTPSEEQLAIFCKKVSELNNKKK